MTADNIFDVIIGSRGKTLKWDALWRMLEWLAKPEKGHGLGSTFREHLVKYCFGDLESAQEEIDFRVEFFLGKDKKGKQKWPDIGIGVPSLSPQSALKLAIIDDISRARANDSRKIENLICYASIAYRDYPKADISVIGISDSKDSTHFSKLHTRFQEEKYAPCRILSLHDISNFIDPNLCTPVVLDFKIWAASLD